MPFPILAFVHRGISEEEAFRLAFTKNVVRRNLLPLEKAHAIHLARERGVKRAELAALFGLSEKQLGRYLDLLDFPKAFQKVLDEGLVSMAHARVLAGYGVGEPEPWVKRIQEEHLDTRALRRLLKNAGAGRGPGRPRAYLQVQKDRIRGYSFTIRRAAPKAEREKLMRVLQEAIQFLGG